MIFFISPSPLRHPEALNNPDTKRLLKGFVLDTTNVQGSVTLLKLVCSMTASYLGKLVS